MSGVAAIVFGVWKMFAQRSSQIVNLNRAIATVAMFLLGTGQATSQIDLAKSAFEDKMLWSNAADGWSIGVPKRPQSFILGRQMVVVLMQKNVSATSLDGTERGCFRIRVVDAKGRDLPGRYRHVECGQGIVRNVRPGKRFFWIFDVADSIKITSVGKYEVYVAPWNRSRPRAQFALHVAARD